MCVCVCMYIYIIYNQKQNETMFTVITIKLIIYNNKYDLISAEKKVNLLYIL